MAKAPKIEVTDDGVFIRLPDDQAVKLVTVEEAEGLVSALGEEAAKLTEAKELAEKLREETDKRYEKARQAFDETRETRRKEREAREAKAVENYDKARQAYLDAKEDTKKALGETSRQTAQMTKDALAEAKTEIKKLYDKASKDTAKLINGVSDEADKAKAGIKAEEAKAGEAYAKARQAYLEAKEDASKIVGSASEEAKKLTKETLEEVNAKLEEIRNLILKESYTEDFGCATVDGTGSCYIYLSKEFMAVAGDNPYQVFVQAEKPGSLSITEKEKAFFLVTGDADLPFSWQVKAK